MAILRLSVQVGVVSLLATIITTAPLQARASYSGKICESPIDNTHKGKDIPLEGSPSGSVYKIPLDKVPVTSTTTAAPGEKPKCQLPYQGNPDLYDWLQILEETGGQPGKLNVTRRPPEGQYLFDEPCTRPLIPWGEEDKIYDYIQSDLKSVFRKEEGFLRFAGTKYEFVDIRGTVVWTPPKAIKDPRVYIAEYYVDDTGSWIDVKKKNCTFTAKPELKCTQLPYCRCYEDELRCKDNRVAGPNLLASLVG